MESLIVSAAHWSCELAEDRRNPRRARARMLREGPREIESAVGSRFAEALGEVLREDST